MAVAQAQQNAPHQIDVAATEEDSEECAVIGPMRIKELEVCLLRDSFVCATASSAHVDGVFGRALESTGTICLNFPISECKIGKAVTDS